MLKALKKLNPYRKIRVLEARLDENHRNLCDRDAELCEETYRRRGVERKLRETEEMLAIKCRCYEEQKRIAGEAVDAVHNLENELRITKAQRNRIEEVLRHGPADATNYWHGLYVELLEELKKSSKLQAFTYAPYAKLEHHTDVSTEEVVSKFTVEFPQPFRTVHIFPREELVHLSDEASSDILFSSFARIIDNGYLPSVRRHLFMQLKHMTGKERKPREGAVQPI